MGDLCRCILCNSRMKNQVKEEVWAGYPRGHPVKNFGQTLQSMEKQALLSILSGGAFCFRKDTSKFAVQSLRKKANEERQREKEKRALYTQCDPLCPLPPGGKADPTMVVRLKGPFVEYAFPTPPFLNQSILHLQHLYSWHAPFACLCC